MKRNAGARGVYPVGGFGIQTRGDINYFDLKQLESAQNWRRKWFYVSDTCKPGRMYGVPPFRESIIVKRKNSWSHRPDAREANEASPLASQVPRC